MPYKPKSFKKRPLDDAIRNSASRRMAKGDKRGLFSPTMKLDTSQVRDVRRLKGQKMTGKELMQRVNEIRLEKKYKENRDRSRTGR